MTGSNSTSRNRPRFLRILGGLVSVVMIAACETGAVDEGSSALSIVLKVASDPDSAIIYVDNRDAGALTPAEIRVAAGEHVMELYLDGYEPLAKRFPAKTGEHLRLEFLLKSLPPLPIAASSLGLARLPTKPLLDERLAEQVKQKWTGMAEAFALIGLGQGLLARLVLPKEQHGAANTMILVGAGLTAGAYALSGILGKRKLRQIRNINEKIPEENAAIKEHNSTVDQAVKDANAARVQFWLEENENRGKVILRKE